MLTTLHSLLARAERGRYAIPAFNATNLETVQGILNVASRMRSPVIIQTSEAAIDYAGHETILGIMETTVARIAKKIPVVTHLDHGKHLPMVKRCVTLGYTSVHMDASEQPYATNVRLTREAVQFGHRHRITVQGELGYLLGYEGMTALKASRKDMQKRMTDPDQAAEFVQKTGVDTLAIAVGTAHGYFQGRERIDFQRLQAIRANVQVPLVLHGGSGVPQKEIKRAITMGIRIINVDTSLRIAFMRGLQQTLRKYNRTSKVDIRKELAAARLTMEQEVARIITLFGSANHA